MSSSFTSFVEELLASPSSDPGPHLSNDDLIACAEDRLTATEQARADRHLDRCAECSLMVLRLQDAYNDAALETPITRLQEMGAAFRQCLRNGLAIGEELWTDFAASLLHALGATPSYAGVRSGGAGPRNGESDQAPALSPDELLSALREIIARSFATETINSTFPGPACDLQIRRLPGQPPVLRARPPGKNWQAFTLIASDASGQKTQLDSLGDSLPLAELAELRPQFTTLAIRFI